MLSGNIATSWVFVKKLSAVSFQLSAKNSIYGGGDYFRLNLNQYPTINFIRKTSD